MSQALVVPPEPGPGFEVHARWCRQAGAGLYAALLDGMAVDLQRGGVVADLVASRDAAGGGAGLHLRLLAALHDLVLAGHAPALEPYYPTVGGTRRPDQVWPVAASVLVEHVERVRGWLDVAPQTNEVGRSAALAVGLLTAAAVHGRRRVRLLQLGASAGLHLLVDSYRIEGAGWAWGPAASSVRLPGAVLGPLPMTPAADEGLSDLSRAIEVVERRGCDLAPVDVRDAAGRRRLHAFVWPEHPERHTRLAAALEIAADSPPAVEQADAVRWLGERLAEPPDDDVLTVVWHAVTLQYLSPSARAGVAAMVARARDDAAVAYVALEASGSHYTSPPQLTLDGRVLGTSAPHGVPVTLLA